MSGVAYKSLYGSGLCLAGQLGANLLCLAYSSSVLWQS